MAAQFATGARAIAGGTAYGDRHDQPNQQTRPARLARWAGAGRPTVDLPVHLAPIVSKPPAHNSAFVLLDWI